MVSFSDVLHGDLDTQMCAVVGTGSFSSIARSSRHVSGLLIAFAPVAASVLLAVGGPVNVE